MNYYSPIRKPAKKTNNFNPFRTTTDKTGVIMDLLDKISQILKSQIEAIMFSFNPILLINHMSDSDGHCIH